MPVGTPPPTSFCLSYDTRLGGIHLDKRQPPEFWSPAGKLGAGCPANGGDPHKKMGVGVHRRGIRDIRVWTCLLLLGSAVAGCGADGISGVILNPVGDKNPRLVGQLWLPGVVEEIDEETEEPGEAAVPPWPGCPLAASVSAGAFQGLGLALLDFDQFSRGRFVGTPVITEIRTDRDGTFEAVSRELALLDRCDRRMMLQAGVGSDTTRALVYRYRVNVSAATEAMVRVLSRFLETTPASMCDFDTDELEKLESRVEAAVCPARGSTPDELNEAAFELAWRNRAVQAMLAEIVRPLPAPTATPEPAVPVI